MADESDPGKKHDPSGAKIKAIEGFGTTSIDEWTYVEGVLCGAMCWLQRDAVAERWVWIIACE